MFTAVENLVYISVLLRRRILVKRPYLRLSNVSFTSEAFMYIRVAVEVAFHYSVEHVERRKRIRELAHEQKLKLTVVKLDIIFVKFEKPATEVEFENEPK